MGLKGCRAVSVSALSHFFTALGCYSTEAKLVAKKMGPQFHGQLEVGS